MFCERKSDADELSTSDAMSADCHVLHGGVPQEKRELVLQVSHLHNIHGLLSCDGFIIIPHTGE